MFRAMRLCRLDFCPNALDVRGEGSPREPNPGGKTLVTNAGSSGKFLGVLDLELGKGAVKNVRHRLLPV